MTADHCELKQLKINVGSVSEQELKIYTVHVLLIDFKAARIDMSL